MKKELEEMLRKEIIENELQKYKAIYADGIRKIALEYIPKYMKSDHFKKLVEKEIESIISEYLFEDSEWLDFKSIEQFINKKIKRGLK